MVEEWWSRYVIDGEQPPIDASRAASRYLDRIQGPPDMEASEEQASLVASLRSVRNALRRAEEDEGRLINLLKASMAGAEALRGPGFRIAWRPTKERRSVDWKAVAADLAPPAEVIDRHTTVSEGTRPFRVAWEGEEA